MSFEPTLHESPAEDPGREHRRAIEAILLVAHGAGFP